MAKLTKAEAARELGISRTTLYKLIHAGTVSVHPDGMIDTAELGRVVSTLSPTVHRGRSARVHYEQSDMDTGREQGEHHTHTVSVHSEQRGQMSIGRQLTSNTPVDALSLVVHTLQKELEAAREREQDYRQQIAWLEHHIERTVQRYDRLLEAPRPAPQSVRRGTAGASPQRLPAEPLPTTWQAILTHLRQVGPQTPALVEQALHLPQTPRHVMKRMMQAGVLTRIGRGVYGLAEQG